MLVATRPVLSLFLLLGLAQAAGAAEPLTLTGRTELPGYSGDFDHFAADVKGNRLFLAAEDHHTLEVFDLDTGKLRRTVSGFDTPHSLLFLPKANRLIVTDSGTAQSKIVDTVSYKIVGSIDLKPHGADAAGYDPSRNRYYIVTGGRDAKLKEASLVEIDPETGRQYGAVKFDSEKVESMAIEQKGDRLYINVTGKNYMAVLDKRTHKVLANWPIREAEQNAPLAFDEESRRLFVVTRKPGKLLVLNADTGATIASFVAPERTDEVIFDKANKRIYVLGGEGYIGVFQQNDPDRYEEIARVPSAKGAKTGILVPELNRLYVALSPGEGKTGAAVLQFAVAPSPGKSQ
jgi:DNA-binding beta-propeller fold protein YncE